MSSDARLTENKEVVQRFNYEVVQNIDRSVFIELMHANFINHSAPTYNNGPDSMWDTFSKVLKPAFPDMRVTILEQIAEGDLVTSRKLITGTHLGKLFDIDPTGKLVEINIIDIVRIRSGKYYEHWSMNNFEKIVTELRTSDL